MSMKESENVDGEDKRCVKIDADSKKKTIRWKSLKEMKGASSRRKRRRGSGKEEHLCISLLIWEMLMP